MKDCRWEPSEQQDQIASLDELRQKCPVAQSEMLGHAVLTHSDVRSVIEDHETFSNAAGSPGVRETSNWSSEQDSPSPIALM